jgi:hypothetical protein
MGSLPLARCRLGLSCAGWLLAVFAPWGLVLAGAPSEAWGQSESADTIYPGDTVVVAKDGVELGLRDKPAIVLKVGDKIRVTEIRGVWIGGHATRDGQRYTGWVHRREVRLAGMDPGGVTPIQTPSLPDDPDCVAALEALNVTLIKNPQGLVVSANAEQSEIDDAALKHFAGLHHLAYLDLSSRPITDAGFALLGDLSVVQELYLVDTKVTDAILPQVARLETLEILAVANTGVTGAQLAELKQLPLLQVLNLAGTEVGDDQLRPLSDMPQLETLVLAGTKVTSQGLVYLTPITRLRVLNLNGCAVDDSGLAHLEPLDCLRMLYVEGTEVTEEGAETLTETRPSLAVFHD